MPALHATTARACGLSGPAADREPLADLIELLAG
jgi:hypothetical protein